MPLSEHEQNMLAQMEEALVAEDPRFANQMKGHKHPDRRRRMILGGLGVLLGLGLLLAGVSLPQLLVGVAGFVLMVAAAAYAFAPPAVAGPDGSVPTLRRRLRPDR